MSKADKKYELRKKRKLRIRKRITGTSERPRLSVFRSAKHVFVQVIDDESGTTLASVGSYSKGKGERAGIPQCGELGKKIAESCLAKDIKRVVFDKNGYAYHGRIKAVADGAREGGLDF